MATSTTPAIPAPTAFPGADFQALPLDAVIAQPLLAAIKAQKASAVATSDFINSFIDEKGVPRMVSFNSEVTTGTDSTKSTQNVTVSAPLLSILPIPNLKIDSLTIDFKYEVTQTLSNSTQNDKGADLAAKAGLAWWSVSLNGHISSTSKQESTMNRSGFLEITVHASQAPVPEGLAKVLDFLTNSFSVKNV
ncbi:DUF2589 domain-containing protein [Flavitalea flava]